MITKEESHDKEESRRRNSQDSLTNSQRNVSNMSVESALLGNSSQHRSHEQIVHLRAIFRSYIMKKKKRLAKSTGLVKKPEEKS